MFTGQKEATNMQSKGINFYDCSHLQLFHEQAWAFQDKNKKKKEGNSLIPVCQPYRMAINITTATLVVTYLQPMIKWDFLTPQLLGQHRSAFRSAADCSGTS